MCELLVRVVDKTNPDDPYLDAQLTKRGDVICIQPDGWPWGREELANPDWRIIKLPGIAAESLAAFTAPEVDNDPANPSRVLQRRAFRLDLDHAVLADAASVMADGERKQPAKAMALTAAQIIRARVRKPARVDPNVLSLGKSTLEL